MLAASDGVDSELAPEKKRLQLSGSVENKRGGEEDVEELSDGVVSRRVSRIWPGIRRGNGAVLRFLGNSFLSGRFERGTNVTGAELGLGLWKAFKPETGARTNGGS